LPENYLTDSKKPLCAMVKVHAKGDHLKTYQEGERVVNFCGKKKNQGCGKKKKRPPRKNRKKRKNRVFSAQEGKRPETGIHQGAKRFFLGDIK